jgi:hypothetical protein
MWSSDIKSLKALHTSSNDGSGQLIFDVGVDNQLIFSAKLAIESIKASIANEGHGKSHLSGSWPIPCNIYEFPDPYSISKHVLVNRLQDPMISLLLPVFCWIPEFQFSNDPIFENKAVCPCPNKGCWSTSAVSAEGYTEYSKARKVVGMQYTYPLIGRRYKCGNCARRALLDDTISYCFTSYDENVLAILPQYMQTYFPFVKLSDSNSSVYVESTLIENLVQTVMKGGSIAGMILIILFSIYWFLS